MDDLYRQKVIKSTPLDLIILLDMSHRLKISLMLTSKINKIAVLLSSMKILCSPQLELVSSELTQDTSAEDNLFSNRPFKLQINKSPV